MRDRPLILVADDNPTNRDIFSARLATQGYDVINAADGEEALSLARERHPDLETGHPRSVSKPSLRPERRKH